MEWSTIINNAGLLAFGGAFLFIQWRQGANKASSEVITAYKEQVSLNQGKISELTREVGTLSGMLKEKDERIKVLEAVVQGRSPEQEKFMQYLTTVAKESTDYMRNTSEILGEIKTFMHHLNSRNEKVDKKRESAPKKT